MTESQMDFSPLINDPCWKEQLHAILNTPKSLALQDFLSQEYSEQQIFPPKEEIFSALNLTPFKDVKVVIIGQDPYHGPGQAHGLAFSVKSPCPPPPSLKNIFKELDISPDNGDLTSWAKQGVLLINTVLTVRQSQAHSHKNKGWEEITDEIISRISAARERVIFVLWGGPAAKKSKLIDQSKHVILESAHPSPLSAYRGFLGCGHFDQINEQLKNWGEEEIDWTIPSVKPTQPELF